jgi:hypothetical protein
MKFCIKWASMYMVIRNEVKVTVFRLSAPRIFDQDCRSLNLLKKGLEIPGKVLEFHLHQRVDILCYTLWKI